jgi:hypothetical protein
MTNEHIFEVQQQEPLVTYPRRDNQSDDWFKQPLRPGVIRTYEVGADNGEPIVREDNEISAFVPEFTDDQDRFGFFDSRTDQGQFRLYENGSLIAERTQFFGSFPVSGQPATYRAELEVSRTAPYWRYSSNTKTVWTFRSSAPPVDVVQPQGILLAGYDLGELDLLNRAERGKHDLGLFVHRQQGAAAAAVTDARLWVSFDDGATWSRVSLVKDKNAAGRFSATVSHPKNAAQKYVSLKVEASDASGSRLDQTIIRAYGLK